MNGSDSPVSKEVATVAFYGVDNTPAAAKALLDCTISWFRQHGHAPDKIGIDGLGRAGQLYSFARAEKKLKTIEYSSVKQFEIYATLPAAKVWWLHFFLAANYQGKYSGTHASIGARCSVLSLQELATSEIVFALIKILRPVYGIAFSRLAQHGPGLFVSGTSCGPPGAGLSGEEYEEELRICRWGDIAMPNQLYKHGLLRDVFPWNYLTSPHLVRTIQGVPLKQWIQQDARRGMLGTPTEGMFIWEVAEVNIPHVRRVLQQAGVIFDWRKNS